MVLTDNCSKPVLPESLTTTVQSHHYVEKHTVKCTGLQEQGKDSALYQNKYINQSLCTFIRHSASIWQQKIHRKCHFIKFDCCGPVLQKEPFFLGNFTKLIPYLTSTRSHTTYKHGLLQHKVLLIQVIAFIQVTVFF